jgi:hypothetical protein
LRDPSRGADAAKGDVCEDLGVERSTTFVPEGGVEGREDNTMRVSVDMSLLSLVETFTVCGEVEATVDNLFGDSRAVSSRGKSEQRFAIWSYLPRCLNRPSRYTGSRRPGPRALFQGEFSDL